MAKINQKGFAPLMVVILVAVVGVFVVGIKNIQHSIQKPTSSETPIAQITAPPSPSPLTASTSQVKQNSPTASKPSTKPVASAQVSENKTQQTSSNQNSNNSNSTTTNTTSSSPTPSPIPSPTPNIKSYTWTGDKINVTTKCSPGDSTFNIEMSGDVISGDSNGIWTTLTGDGRTIIVSYDSGNGSSAAHIGFNFSGQVTSIRAELPISLKTSGSTTYGYEIKAYSAPFTYSTPNLSTQIGGVRFATDCK